MKRVNAYILIVFIGLSSLFVFLTKETSSTTTENTATENTYDIPSDEKPFVYTGIQQDRKAFNKKAKIQFKAKRVKLNKNTKAYSQPQVQNASEEKKATETAAVAATKNTEQDKPKLDKDGNPIKEESKKDNTAEGTVVYNQGQEEHNFDSPEENSENNNANNEPAIQAETVNTFFGAQEVAANGETDSSQEEALQLAEWRAYLFDSPSSDKFNEFLADFNSNQIEGSVFRNLITEAFQTEETQTFAFDTVKQVKSSFAFNLLASTYDSNNDSAMNTELLAEINTYSQLENVSFLRSTLQSPDTMVFETSLNVLRLSIDTHLGGRTISSTDSETSASEIFASFLPVFSSLDQRLQDESRLSLFDSIFSSLQALLSIDEPQGSVV